MEETRYKLPEASPSGGTQDSLISLGTVVTTCVKCCQPEKLVRESAPRVFTGDFSHRHPLPSVYRNSRLPEGKQVFSINHIVLYKPFRHCEPFLSGNEGNPPKIQVPGHLPRTNHVSRTLLRVAASGLSTQHAIKVRNIYLY